MDTLGQRGSIYAIITGLRLSPPEFNTNCSNIYIHHDQEVVPMLLLQVSGYQLLPFPATTINKNNTSQSMM